MTTKIDDLTKMHNIGKILADKLNVIGIENADQLKDMGAEDAFVKIKTVDDSACINMLCALEGAIQGIRWHDLDIARKEELKAFFSML